jgi:hypothetical protein
MDRHYEKLPSLLGACCQFNPSLLAKSPAILGAFLNLAKLVRELEPEARTTAINLALNGTEIPGFTLVRHENPGYVETKTLLDLFSSCPIARIPALLAAIVEMLGHISGDRYRSLCSVVGVNPTETAIKRAGANPFLRQNSNNP